MRSHLKSDNPFFPVKITPFLQLLAQEIGADLVALAIYDDRIDELTWNAAYGSLSDRYSGISLRAGSGIAGKVFVDNEVLHLRVKELTDNRVSYPIFAVEQLEYAVAVPVGSGERTIGVLLAGNRTDNGHMNEFEVYELAMAAEQIRLLFSRPPSAKSAHRQYDLNESLLFNFFTRELPSRGLPITVEILDQRMAMMHRGDQETLVRVFRSLIDRLPSADTESIRISIEKQGNPYIVLKLFVRSEIPYTPDELTDCSRIVSRIGGVAQMDQSARRFDMSIRYPIALLCSKADENSGGENLD